MGLVVRAPEQYVEANNIPDEKRVVVFLTAAWARTYDTLKDRRSPTKPALKHYKELRSVLTKYYQQRLCEIAERV